MATFIGICDGFIRPGEPLSAETSKIGGRAVSFHDDTSLVQKCPLCQRNQLLVAQIYCPLENSPYHRALYVSACISATCWNKSESWTVNRSQKLDESFKTAKPERKHEAMFDSDEWGDEADDWGTAEDDWGDADDAELSIDGASNSEKSTNQSNNAIMSEENMSSGGSAMEKTLDSTNRLTIANTPDTDETIADGIESMSLSETGADNADNGCTPEDLPTGGVDIISYLNTKDNTRKEDSTEVRSCTTLVTTDTTFVSYYLNVFEEPEDCEDDSKHLKKLLGDYVRKENVDLESIMEITESGKGKTTEKYEKTLVKHGDVAFQKFLKVVKRCPQQSIRYCWNGSPLHMVNRQSVIPPCQYCGSPRVYEMQVMPALVSLLKIEGAAADGAVLEFGTVIVYSCVNSCWSEGDTCRAEHIDVQADPDQHLFK